MQVTTKFEKHLNTNLRQQLLPTKTYEKAKLHQKMTWIVKCAHQSKTVTHIMSACSKIVQSLYTLRHDKMLRPYYHYLISAYGFNEESDHKRHWCQQRPPIPVIENSLVTTNWNIEFHMEKKGGKQRKQFWYCSNGQGEDTATHRRKGLRYRL